MSLTIIAINFNHLNILLNNHKFYWLIYKFISLIEYKNFIFSFKNPTALNNMLWLSNQIKWDDCPLLGYYSHIVSFLFMLVAGFLGFLGVTRIFQCFTFWLFYSSFSLCRRVFFFYLCMFIWNLKLDLLP